MKAFLGISFVLTFVIFLQFTSLTVWESISVAFSVYFLFSFLNNLGNKIVVMDLAIIMAAMTCLVVTIIFYHVYPKENALARLWVKYMFVSSDEYFSFVTPAIAAMALGLRIRIGKQSSLNKNPKLYIDNMKKVLEKKSSLGLALIMVGLISGILDFLSPKSLQQVFYLLDHLTFVGVFYVLYSPNKYKRIITPLVIALMVGQSLATGMFGDMVFMLACTVVLILLGRNIKFYIKLVITVIGLYIVLLLQSVKSDYRKKVWAEQGGADVSYYFELVGDRISNPSNMFDPEKSFFMAVRMNQGWLVGTTMYKVPSQFDFAYGETIWQSVAAAIVPRFLWPDKPEAGGLANLKRFWGYEIKGYSMNIGPLGEAYANFDVVGGIIFMFFYGAFFNFIIYQILKFAEKRPTIILWIPFMFFYAIGVETDLLTTMGSLIKALIFTWVIFRAFRIAFRIDL